jgi:uncharacterized pyridoxamine 5'-phosphate oxidase family protein
MSKIVILLIVLCMASCTDSGGGGGKKSLVKSPVTQAGDGEIEDIIDDLDEETLSNINAVYASMDESPSFESIGNIDTHYGIQKFNIFNVADSPITYLINTHADGLKVYQFDIDAGTYHVFNSSISERIKNIIHYEEDVYFITQRPIKLYKGDKTSNTLTLEHTFDSDLKAVPKKIGKIGNDLCLYTNQNKLFYYDLLSNANFQKSLNGNIQKVYCNTNATILQRKENDIQQIIRTNHDTETVLLEKNSGNKIALFPRGGTLIYRETLLKNETRPRNIHNYYNAYSDIQLTSLPIAPTNFNYFKTFINTTDTSLNYKSFQFDIINKKTSEKVLSLEINDAIERENQYQKLFVVEDELYVTTRSAKNLYKLDGNEFIKLGNPHNLNIISLFVYNNQLTMATNGRYLFQVDNSLPWTFGTEDYYFAKRDEITHNPVMLQRVDHNYHSVKVNDNNLEFLFHKPQKEGSLILNLLGETLIESNDSMRLYPTSGEDSYFSSSVIRNNPASSMIIKNDEIEIENHNQIKAMLKWNDDVYFYIYANQIWRYNTQSKAQDKILTFSGKRVHSLIKTANEKLLIINDSNLELVNPDDLSSEVIIQLDMQALHSVRSMKILNGELYLIDRYFKLHKINIPLYKLMLFDEEINV